MISDDLSIFVNGIENYFNVSCASPARVGTPFLAANANHFLLEYTGVISISGNYNGAILFTAPKRLLMKVLHEHGLMCTQENKLIDLVGEISNTLSGNARREFGEHFKVMPPTSFCGVQRNLPNYDIKTIFVIPIDWNRLTANLIINIENSPTH